MIVFADHHHLLAALVGIQQRRGGHEQRVLDQVGA